MRLAKHRTWAGEKKKPKKRRDEENVEVMPAYMAFGAVIARFATIPAVITL